MRVRVASFLRVLFCSTSPPVLCTRRPQCGGAQHTTAPGIPLHM
jgi:hypothetical protein